MNKQKFLVQAVLILILFCSPAYALLTYYGGGTYTVYWKSPEPISIDQWATAQETTVELVEGGEASDVDAYGNSVFKLDGGICSYVYLHDNSTAFIDGMHYRLTLFDNSTMTIYNSVLQTTIEAYDTSEVIVYGYGFMIDNQPIENGTHPMPGYVHRLTGYYENEMPFSYVIWGDDTARLTLVPEPATFTLLGLGGLLLMKKNSRACS